MKIKKAALTKINPAFIPYACHYDEDTILTKNGNLLKTIKITGFSFEQIGKNHISLRDTIRKTIEKNIPNNSFSIYLHTIRRKKDLSLMGDYQNIFTKTLNDDWDSVHDWRKKFVNELYITIITSNKNYKIFEAISFTSLKILEKNFLAKTHKLLEKVFNNIFKDLQEFGARKLCIFSSVDEQKEFKISEGQPEYFSGFSRFFSKIINLEDKHFPAINADLAEQLSNSKIFFGKNMLETVNQKKKHFATILSIKEYSELSLNKLDEFLQLPHEFIITQTLDFIKEEEVSNYFKEQEKYLEVSGDKKLKEILEIETGKKTTKIQSFW